VGGYILLVEDEAPLRASMKIALVRAGYDVTDVGSRGEAERALEQEGFDVVLTDLWLPDGDGIEVLGIARERAPQAQVLIVTAFASVDTAVEAMRNGAFDFVKKPFGPEQLVRRVEIALQQRRLTAELERLGTDGDAMSAIAGRSNPMEEVRAQIRVAAVARAVLVQGETGTGKELVARAIHEASACDGAFVVVNCAGLSESIMDSELFGHVRGAFTGAETARRGLLEEAHQGTLFLDELGELPLPLQAKLLRFLQFGEVKPLGSNRTAKVQTRVVAATNRDLREEVEARRFREDLLYRLDVMRIDLPPLRRRLDDLPELCDRLLERVASHLGQQRPSISTPAVERLGKYRWPGNVRELENILERAMLMSRGQDLLPEHFGFIPEASSEPETLADVERRHILGVLDDVGGDRKQACDRLAISMSTMRRKLIEYGRWTESVAPSTERQ